MELANKRVNRAINDLRLIANLANTRNYEFTDQQAKKIVKALQKEVDSLKKYFLESDQSNNDEFRL